MTLSHRKRILSVFLILSSSFVAGCSSTAERTAPKETSPAAHSNPEPQSAAGASSSSNDKKRVVEVEISLPPLEASGIKKAVLGWYTADEWQMRKKLPMGHLMEWVKRVKVVELDLSSTAATRASLTVPSDQDIVVFGVLDLHQEFWQVWFGGGRQDAPWGHASVPPLDDKASFISLSFDETLPAKVPKEKCVEERMTLLEIDAPQTVGHARWANSGRQKVCVLVPKGYDATSSKRYPTLYLLPGLFSDHMSKLGKRGVRSILDDLGAEFILVGVDGRTATGSSYFYDGPVNGAWFTFMSEQVVQKIDQSFRTLPSSRSRALLGQSTGGFNAISLALRKPEVFGAALASAPDGLDLDTWLFPSGNTMDAEWLAWLRLEKALGVAGQMTSYAADFSPNVTTTDALDWPVNVLSGKRVPAVWKKWLRQSPYEWLSDSVLVANVREHLDGRLFLEAASDDEFKLGPPAKRFSERLKSLNIKHHFGYFPGGHGGSYERFERALPLLVKVLDGETAATQGAP